MLLFLLILGFLLLYVGLFFLLPKGFLLQELIHLPLYWIRMFTTDTSDLKEEKHFYGAHKKQYILYLKSKSKVPNKKNAVIYIHGGGWRFGSPEFFRPNAHFLNQQGYLVILPSHRKTPRHKYKDQIEDIAKAVELAKQILSKEGRANQQITIGGISSGGHLSASLLYDNKLLEKLKISRSVFAGVFLLAAPLNLRLMRQTPIVKSLSGKTSSPSYKEANPYDNIPTDENIPHLIIQGEKDGMVNAFSTLCFVDKFNSLNPGLLQFESLQEGTHLDAGKWMFRKDEVGVILSRWLNQLESS